MRRGGWWLRFPHRCAGLLGLTAQTERPADQLGAGFGQQKSPPTSLSRAGICDALACQQACHVTETTSGSAILPDYLNFVNLLFDVPTIFIVSCIEHSPNHHESSSSYSAMAS